MGEVYSSPSIDENSMSSRNEHCECHTKNAKETKTQEMQREKTHETKVVQRMNDILQVRPSYIFTCKGANLTPQLPCPSFYWTYCPSFHTGHNVHHVHTGRFILDGHTCCEGSAWSRYPTINIPKARAGCKNRAGRRPTQRAQLQ
jgi:hypothetical protein